MAKNISWQEIADMRLMHDNHFYDDAQEISCLETKTENSIRDILS
jgi:hypothetical protein